MRFRETILCFPSVEDSRDYVRLPLRFLLTRFLAFFKNKIRNMIKLLQHLKHRPIVYMAHRYDRKGFISFQLYNNWLLSSAISNTQGAVN